MKVKYNKSYPVKWLVAYILLFHCSTVTRAQFTNGDFSLGTNGCNAGTGWTTSTGIMAPQRTETYQPGNPWIDITPCGGWGNGSWIEQAVPMVVGNHYRIEFDITSHCGWDGSLAGVYITLDGKQLCDPIYNDTVVCPPPLGWQRRRSVVFTAVNNPTVIRFTGEGRCRDVRGGAYPCYGPGTLGNPGVVAFDNVVLVSMPSPQIQQVALGNDTLYCEPFTRVLDAGNAASGTSYIWSTGDTTQTLTVSSGGAYWCSVNTICGISSDTITLTQGTMPQVNLGGNVEACTGDVVTLQPPGAFPGSVQYTWNTSATTPSITVTQPGTYWVEVDDNGCAMRDTVEVSYIDINVDLGADLALCDRDTPVILTSPQPAGYHYLWSNGLSDTQMHVTRSGSHWLEVSYNNCVSSDTIHVALIPTPNVFIGPDSIICEQFPYRIGAEIAGAAYQWSTGETTPYIRIDSTGNYLLQVNLDGCMVYDTVSITAMATPAIDLGGDRDICPNQTIVLDATYQTNSSYLWNTGETTASVAVTSEGFYGVQVISQYHCIGGDSVTLTYYPQPVVSLPEDTVVCAETPLVLIPWYVNADSLLWSEGSVGNTLSIKYGGIYTVTGINKCGTGSDTILVKDIFCDIWLPNVFTPNGDGANDVFRALGNVRRLEGFSFSVFNRWGQQLFRTEDKYKGWDGKHDGEETPVGTYIYMLQYSLNGRPYMQKGDFHLMR